MNMIANKLPALFLGFISGGGKAIEKKEEFIILDTQQREEIRLGREESKFRMQRGNVLFQRHMRERYAAAEKLDIFFLCAELEVVRRKRFESLLRLGINWTLHKEYSKRDRHSNFTHIWYPNRVLQHVDMKKPPDDMKGVVKRMIW